MIIQQFGNGQVKSGGLVILDRDGTINIDGGYTHKIEELSYLPGVIDAIQLISSKNYNLIVVSNQSGIGRGKYNEKQLFEFNNAIWLDFKKAGLEGIIFISCPHLPEQNCKCRKPKSLMLNKALELSKVEKKDVIFIGDKLSDLNCGMSFGIQTELNETQTIFQIIRKWLSI